MKRLIDVLKGQRYEKDFDVYGANIKLQSLWKNEETLIYARFQGYDFLSQMELAKVPILAKAVVSIENVAISAYPEIRDIMQKDKGKDISAAMEEFLGNLDAGVVDYLYKLYMQLKDEREKERLSNSNFSQEQKVEPSTISANSLDVGPKNLKA